MEAARWQSQDRLSNSMLVLNTKCGDLVPLVLQLASELQSVHILLMSMRSQIHSQETSWTNHQEELA